MAIFDEEGKHFSKSGFISKNRYEREADIFATEFLMPWKLIESIANARQPGFSVIQRIASECESSLLASAIRYTSVTPDCIAVIVSNHGVVEFMTASSTFRQIPGLSWLQREDRLPKGVPTARLASDSDWVGKCEISTDGTMLSHWFSGVPNLEVEEDIVGLGSYGRILTVLIADFTSPEDSEEHEEDDYIDRWKEGRFRPRK